MDSYGLMRVGAKMVDQSCRREVAAHQIRSALSGRRSTLYRKMADPIDPHAVGTLTHFRKRQMPAASFPRRARQAPVLTLPGLKSRI
jgi:hypothetical protein